MAVYILMLFLFTASTGFFTMGANDVKVRTLGRIIYVDDDWDDDPLNHHWNTICEGIDDAEDGDTVFVYRGTYCEALSISKSISLEGEKRDTTFIIDNDCDSTAMVDVLEQGVEISGFTFNLSEGRDCAILIARTSSCNIHDNTFNAGRYSWCDIRLYRSPLCSISNNNFNDNYAAWFMIYSEKDSYGCNISNNNFNSFEGADAIRISGREDNAISEKVNNVISENTFKGIGGMVRSISIENVSNNIISGNVISLAKICVSNSNNNRIYDNTIDDIGIIMTESKDNEIYDNTITYSGYSSGLVFDGIYMANVKGNYIHDNKIISQYQEHASYGIVLLSVFEEFPKTRYNIICNNIISDCNVGIVVGDPWDDDGLFSSFVQSNIISNNTISGHKWSGIWIAGSDTSYNKFFSNDIKDNKKWGIKTLFGAHDNKLYHNNFINNGNDNNENNGNAYDESSNDWYNKIKRKGNYWDDWSGSGSCYISGGNNEDFYPLSEPYEGGDDSEDRIKAKKFYGDKSDWTDLFPFKASKNKAINLLLLKLLELSSNAFSLLQCMLGPRVS